MKRPQKVFATFGTDVPPESEAPDEDQRSDLRGRRLLVVLGAGLRGLGGVTVPEPLRRSDTEWAYYLAGPAWRGTCEILLRSLGKNRYRLSARKLGLLGLYTSPLAPPEILSALATTMEKDPRFVNVSWHERIGSKDERRKGRTGAATPMTSPRHVVTFAAELPYERNPATENWSSPASGAIATRLATGLAERGLDVDGPHPLPANCWEVFVTGPWSGIVRLYVQGGERWIVSADIVRLLRKGLPAPWQPIRHLEAVLASEPRFSDVRWFENLADADEQERGAPHP